MTLTKEIIEAAEKDFQFVADVVEGTSDTVLNPRTGQVQKTLPATIDGIDWSYVGKFADGVTFTKKSDFAIDANGTQWIYTGNYPFYATAGTVPSEPTYQVVHVKSASAISNANGGSVQDFIDTVTFKTVADMKAFTNHIVGSKVIWQGYYSQSDGGSNWGIVKSGAHVDDGGSIFSIDANTYIDANVSGCVDITKFGAREGETYADETTSAILNALLSTGRIKIQGKYYFNQQIKLSSGCTIEGVNSNDDWLIWVGEQSVYAIESSDIDNGVFNVSISGLSIRGQDNTNTALLLNAEAVRQSKFKDVRLRNYLVALRSTSTWYNSYEDCELVAGGAIDGSVNTIGVLFPTSIGAQFPLTNATSFRSVAIIGNYIGISAQSIGDAVNFGAGCTLEENGIAVEFSGSGNCHGLTFDSLYIELNNKNFVINKSGGGTLYGVSVLRCMIGYAANGAGVLDVAVNNAGAHRLTFESNRFRGDVVPSSGYALTTTASITGMAINWYDNRGQTGGSAVLPWDQDSIDWRYLNSDVAYAVTNLVGWTSTVPLQITTERGIATLTGDISNLSNTDTVNSLSIANDLPVALRPVIYSQYIVAEAGTNSLTAANAITATIQESGKLRVQGAKSGRVCLSFSWCLNPSTRRSANQSI
jgi:hypothetical protein